MRSEQLAQGFAKLVEVNGRVQSGEVVVVVTDGTMAEIAEGVAETAAAFGAEVVTCIQPPRARDGEEPAAPVAAAMAEADVIFTPVSTSVTHTKAMRTALDRGARAILMTAHTEGVLTSSALLDTDFEKQAELCRRIGTAFDNGREVRLSSPRGTDLSFSIVGRKANVLTNIPSPGELAPVPDIEVNVVPVTGSANGTLIADASVPYLGIGVLEEPVVCKIVDGFITSIEGGQQARILDDALRSYEDRNCYNVAELGIGLNPNARLTGDMLEDEGVLGTIHIGIGTSHTLGGEVMAPTHYDLLMWQPIIEVDGRMIQNDRDILI